MDVEQNKFTLIELLVDTFISTMRFFKRGDKQEVQNTPLFLSGKRAASEVSRPSRWSGLIESLKNTPLFLKEKGGAGERSHLCCDRVYGKEEGLSPALGQVKLYSFTCPRAGEAVQLHLNRTSCGYCYLISAFFQARRQTGGAKYSAFFERERGRGGKRKLFFP